MRQTDGGVISKRPHVGLKRLNCCFVADTPIKTSTGYADIEDLKIGDQVLSQNVVTGEISLQPVTDTHIRPVSEIKTFYKLRLGSATGQEDLFVTGEHPFWVPSQNAWVTVDDLALATELVTYKGATVFVLDKVLQKQAQQTYNITVAGNSTYFAGQFETLVHNCGELVGRTSDGLPIHAVAKTGGNDLFFKGHDGRYYPYSTTNYIPDHIPSGLRQDIADARNSTIPDKQLEGDVAWGIRDQVTNFNHKFGINSGNGEIDITTAKALVEVKNGKSFNAARQMKRLVTSNDLNPIGKPVIYFAPKISGRQFAAAVKSADIDASKVVHVRTIEELRKVLADLPVRDVPIIP